MAASASADTAFSLWYCGANKVEIRQELLASPEAGEVRVKALYSAVSRGTESLVFAGKVPESEFGRMRAPFMLRTLDCARIVLLTNNPAKLDGLAKAGIEIAARVPLEAPVTLHNKRYLTTKAMRSGHKLVTLKASPKDTS